jgi:hypothetical protein
LVRIFASAVNTAPLDIVILSEPRLPVNTPELSKAPVLVPVAVILLRSAARVDEIAVTATLPAPVIDVPLALAAVTVAVKPKATFSESVLAVNVAASKPA